MPTREEPRATDAIDGRRQRATRSRQAIIDAVIALQEGGAVRATAQQIAEKAGLSPRSIFTHFPTQEELTLAVMGEIEQRFFSDLFRATPPGSLDVRITALLDRRIPLLEKLVAYRRSAVALQPLPRSVVSRRRMARRALRNEVGVVFAPELARLDDARRDETLLALSVALESEAWDSLRGGAAVSVARARGVVELTVRSLLR